MRRPKTLLKALLMVTTLMVFSGAANAQQSRDEAVVLVADSVFLQGQSILTATGNVEAIYGESKLTAQKIIYNGRTDQITIEGPIQITDPQGVTIFAEFAELDSDLQNGLLKSARLVLNEQVRITAKEMRRIDGRQSQLEYATATSCKTCETGQAPLWQIRAKRVTHDQDEQQLYFDSAQFRLFDVPVFYVPRLRLPDPTLNRSSGFLIPNIRARSRLGTGIRLPYFIALGDHRDLTLTPYLATQTRTLEWRYRQAFVSGDIEFKGAISDDDFSGRGTRAYLFANGAFDLPNDYKLRFQIQNVSDAAYLADYDFSNQDRLSSSISLSRVNRQENTQLSFTGFESVRTGEDNETLPSLVLSARKQLRFQPALIGGEAMWELEAHSLFRTSNVDTDANGDGVVDGRDVSRVNAALDWRRNWLLPRGLEFGTTASINFDAVKTRQDATLSDLSYAEITPAVAATLRYPWIKRDPRGVTQIVEPIAQIGWSGGTLRAGTPIDLVNEESTRVEFDEGNLLALSRFPSDDRRERGLSAAWGVNWSRMGPDWTAQLTFGQVVREDTHPDFSRSSGLAAQSSDYLVAGKIQNALGLELTARTLFDGIEGLNKVEARGGWHNDRLGLNASYIWLDADPAEDRTDDLSEWNLDGSYRMGRHWTGLGNLRYDVASGETAEAGMGFAYRNECLRAKFEVSRRFTSSTAVKPATDYSFTVEILGFSAKTIDKSYARKCNDTAG